MKLFRVTYDEDTIVVFAEAANMHDAIDAVVAAYNRENQEHVEEDPMRADEISSCMLMHDEPVVRAVDPAPLLGEISTELTAFYLENHEGYGPIKSILERIAAYHERAALGVR